MLWMSIMLTISSIYLFFFNGNIYSFLNLSFLPIVLIAYVPKKRFVTPFFALAIVSYVFIMTVYDLYNGNWVEGGDRIAGPFTSSLHLSYFCVFFAYFIANGGLKYRLVLSTLIFISALISGSRVAAVGVILMSTMNFSNKRLLAFILLFLPLILWVSNDYGLRSFTYVPDAEAVRFGGFARFANMLDVELVLKGFGRYTYGATGYRFVGEKAFITESSLMMILYSYGIVIGSVILLMTFYRFYKLTLISSNFRYLLVFILLTIFSPLLDSTAVLFINMLILSNFNVTQTSFSHHGLRSYR